MLLKNSETNKIKKINPLTIIFFNIIIPVVNTLFPSDKGIIFTYFVVMLILVVSKKFKYLLKSLLFLVLFYFLYIIIDTYLNVVSISVIFKITTLFLPFYILGYLLISDYSSSEILTNLEKLKLPKIFVIGLIVTTRYIPTFVEEFKIIKSAMIIRGLKFSIKNPIQTFEYLIVPQLFRCLAISGELTSAGITKGISSPNRRTSFLEQKFSLVDYLIILILILGHGVIICKMS